MQPSQYEIQREVEALRDIRRRSTSQGGPGALILDPDLPNPAAPTPPTHWTQGPGSPLADGDLSNTSHEDDTSSPGSSSDSPADDPFHLFWVPANLHPEIAPAEFRAFLKEHARGPPAANGTIGTIERSNSQASASSLGRKKSMLSRQYKPSENDGVEDEKVVPLRRNRSVFSNQGPQLTMSDLQKLEELAEEASVSDDPTKLRTMLRRSLSLNVSPSEVDQMDEPPDLGDEANLPIIVPPPGQILRRAARTKIRKPSLPGDGGGHRFQATRRGTRGPVVTPTSPEQRLSTDTSSSEHHTDTSDPPNRARTFSGESFESDGFKNDSLSQEPASTFEPYAKMAVEDEEIKTPTAVRSLPPMTVDIPLSPPPPEVEIPQSAPPVLHHPQPQRATLSPPQDHQRSLPRSPSPDPGSLATSTEAATSRSPPRQDPSSFFSTTPSPQRKDKDKKSLFGKWGGDKDKKKGGKDKERENQRVAEKEKEKEKESGFFGSLFGGKKKQDESTTQSLGHGASGRETAAALLGASKSSKSYVPPTSPSLAGVNGSYARYPIHVERAIYRLSHIKLANPRRPLYEQVLISNLMFWYLGVINKTQNPSSPPSAPAEGGQANTDNEQKEKEAKEKAELEKAEQERLEKEREKERMVEQKKESRRGSLTKTPSAGSPGSGRRAAEMPVRGPQYEMQHRVMEQEYGGFSAQSSNAGHGSGPQPMGRSVSTPSPSMGGQSRNQQQLPHISRNYFAGGNGPESGYEEQIPSPQRTSSPNLPPGAMAPVNTEQQTWLAQSPSGSQSPRPRVPSSPSPPPAASTSPPPTGYPNPRRSRSPPPQNQQSLISNRYTSGPQPEKHVLAGQGGGRSPGRSQSVTAVSSQPLATRVNGGLKKGNSVHSTVGTPIPNGRRQSISEEGREEEDLPLGLWQQRQRK